VLRDVRRALLIRLRSLGDAVLMTPVPTALKAWRPSLYVAVLIEEPFAAVFRDNPSVDEVVALPQGATPAQRAHCLAQIRRARFDLVFNMHSGSTAGLLTALSGAPLRVTYARARFAAACHVRVPPLFRREHTVLHQLRPLAQLGIPIPERPELELHVDPETRKRVAQQLAERRLRPGEYIVMQPFSNWATKEWPPARFAELARLLIERYRLPILVLAGPSETRKLERLLALADGAITAMRDVPVAELIAWIERCALVVGNDSGPAHVAAALGKPNVVIFGSADPEVWRPWAGRHQLLRPDFPCIPCAGDRCYEFDAPRCIESITVEQVRDAVARIAPVQAEAGPVPARSVATIGAWD
jgi:ADP-heptose:LPS heptosyltransferase